MPNNHPSIDDIKAICRDRGARFTQGRQQAFEALLAIGKPVSAYDLLSYLETSTGNKLAPLTVYRSLDFLAEQGFVHKITSNHTFTVCVHPEHEHSAMHLVCNECGSGQELPIADIKPALHAAASQYGFLIDQNIVELQGVCQRCQSAE